MKRVISFLILLTVSLATVEARTLVLYYSYTGNCEAIANALTNQMTADVLEIEPAEKGLRYDANNYALGTQLLNAIKANPNDASSYPPIDPVSISALRHWSCWNMIRKYRLMFLLLLSRE